MITGRESVYHVLFECTIVEARLYVHIISYHSRRQSTKTDEDELEIRTFGSKEGSRKHKGS